MAGMSFLPSNNGPDKAAMDALKPGQTPLQVLTLNLPKILGQNAPTSAPMMPTAPGAPEGGPTFSFIDQQPGMTGGQKQTPQSMVMQALMRSLMGGGGPTDASGDELRRRLGLSVPDGSFAPSTPMTSPGQALDAAPSGAVTSPQPPDVYRPTEGGQGRPV